MDTPADDGLRYLAWKKNAPHLYDTLLVFELPWPSRSVDWLPEIRKEQPGAKPGNVELSEGSAGLVTRQRLVLTTNTGGNATEYLRIGELAIPEIPAPHSLAEYDPEQGTVGNYQPSYAADLRIVQRIQVDGIVEHARYMPQNPNVVATVASTGEAAIWDTTKFPYKPVNHYVPTVKLIGHKAEAQALNWSPLEEGMLATGDANGDVFIWDMQSGYDSKTGVMDPKRRRHHAEGTAVNDVVWHPTREAMLASCGDDGWLHVHVTNSDQAPPVLSHQFGADAPKPTALAWNPVNSSLLAVGFDSGKIELLDLRSTPPVSIFTFENGKREGDADTEYCHTDYITSIRWNTWHPSILASSSVDGTVKIWNAALFKSKPLLTHGGHKAAVTGVSWNPAVPRMLSSVAEDNGLHVYEPSDDILGF